MVRLYLDSAPIIYHVERTMPFAGAVDARLTVSGVVLVMPNSLASSVSRLRLFDHPEGTVFRNPRRPKIRVPLRRGQLREVYTTPAECWQSFSVRQVADATPVCWERFTLTRPIATVGRYKLRRY